VSWTAVPLLLMVSFCMCRLTRVALPKNLWLWALAGALSCVFIASGAAFIELYRVGVWNWDTGVLHACVYFDWCPRDFAYQVFREAMFLLVPFVTLVLAVQRDASWPSGVAK